MGYANNRVSPANFPSNVPIKNLCAMGGDVYALDGNLSGSGTYPRVGSLWRLNGASWDLVIDDYSSLSNRIIAHGSSVIRVNTGAFRGVYSWSSGSSWTQLGTSSSFTAQDAVSVGGTLYVMTSTGVGTLSGATLTMVATFSGSSVPVPYGGYPGGFRIVSYAGSVYIITEAGNLLKLGAGSFTSTLPAIHSNRNLASTFRGRNPFEVNGVLYYASQCANSTFYNPVTGNTETALQNGQLFSYSGSGSAWTALVTGVSGNFYYDLCADASGTIFISAQSGGYGSYVYNPATSSLLAQPSSMGSWETSVLFGARLLNDGVGDYLSEITTAFDPAKQPLQPSSYIRRLNTITAPRHPFIAPMGQIPSESRIFPGATAKASHARVLGYHRSEREAVEFHRRVSWGVG
jgi:hypothetical protein